MALAAAALYISIKGGEERTQTHIAYAAGITEVTLRNRTKDIKNQMHMN
jgi:transcription initiation factor TFIIB